MADRRKFEEILQELRDRGEDDLADELEQGYGTSRLREEAKRAAELERERDEWKAKAERLERAPVREKAFRDYGVDFEALRPLERAAIEGYDGELTPEAIARFVETNGLPMKPPATGGNAETPPPAEGVVRAAQQAPAGRVGTGPQITPEVVRGWPADKWLRFRQEHPEAAEQILQGRTVTGIAF